MYIAVFALFITGCADAGKDQRVISNRKVTLDASASKADLYGKITKYRWKQIGGEKVQLSDKKVVFPTFVAPTVSKKTKLVFKLTTVETGGIKSPYKTRDYVTIIVKPQNLPNKPPTAIAKSDTTEINNGGSITFNATQSSDSDGNIVSYKWHDENDMLLSTDTVFTKVFTVAGEHTIKLTVTDNMGATATDSIDIIVHTVDTTKPVITLLGENPVEIVQGNVYSDAGATATDDRDGDITQNIIVHSNVDTTTIGSYSVQYDVNDTASNEAVSVIRTVHVVLSPDTTPPVITLNGESNITLTVGDIYTELGVTAVDDRDGNVSVDINGTVHINTTGVYMIEYTAKDTAMNVAKSYRTVNIVEAVLLSISLEADTQSLDVNEITLLKATGHYNNNTLNDISSFVEWIISDNNIVTVDANGTLKALKKGTVTIKAKKGELESSAINIKVTDSVILQSLSVSPNPVNFRVGSTVQVNVTGLYSDGSTQSVEGLEYIIADSNIALVDDTGSISGIDVGATVLNVRFGVVTASINIVVAEELNTTNFNFTNFGSTYLDQIPTDATLTQYDEKRFCMIAGQILAENGSPLSGVRVFIHAHPEYGSVLTDSNGTYVLPAEGGLQLTMRYTKQGYTTIDRKIQALVQDWVRSPDVTMLAEDMKVTSIDLNNTTPQIHISTPVTDDRGERSTTLVFDGVTKAIITAPDGSTRELTNLNVRATEFKIPESMPGDLPKQIGFTYCSDIKVDGVSDDEIVTFDAPVIMYVENFIGFKVGGIVPVGYYDRNSARWIGSPNGIVVRLLDTDGDGKVDALDSDNSGTPNDLNGDGEFTDEVSGIADNPKYKSNDTFWRVEIRHFTPWDHNWPWPDGSSPDDDDWDTDDDTDPDNDCNVPISSYVTAKSRVFHEGIPIVGTSERLHYSSKRTEGYKKIIDVTVDTTDVAYTVWSAIIRFSIAGRVFVKEYNTGGIIKASFEWDGRDMLGKRYLGDTKGYITVGYRNTTQYIPPKQDGEISWGKVASSAMDDLYEAGCISGCMISWRVLWGNPRSIDIFNENINQFAHGWSISGHSRASGNMVIQGDGTIGKNNPLSKSEISTVFTDPNRNEMITSFAVNDKSEVFFVYSYDSHVYKVT